MVLIDTPNYPKVEDGCAVGTWRCKNPSLEGIKSGMDKKTDAKVCPVCHMPLCEAHMSIKRHMEDCNWRSNQERQLLEGKRIEEAKERKAKIEDQRRLEMMKKEFEANEERRKKIIDDRNEEYKRG